MWISRGEYRRLLRSYAQAERRADTLFAALAEERAANREAERHWANQVLRARGSFPMPTKSVALPSDAPALELTSEVPGMDAGELDALVLAGAQYGVSRADVIRELRNERGL